MSETKHPTMHAVTSSNVDAIGYDEAGNMHVRFKNGGHYIYADVPRSLFDKARDAASIGKFIAQHIKGAYTGRRL